MYYSKINECDIANGNGVRVTLFVSGCTNKCKGCFQPETWDFHYGQEFTCNTMDKIIEYLKPDHIKGLTILGGEPLNIYNTRDVLNIIEKVKETYPDKDIWVFSGYTYEELYIGNYWTNQDHINRIFELIDVLVDGRFEEDKRDISLKFRGSSNQRVIDMNKTTGGNIVLLDL